MNSARSLWLSSGATAGVFFCLAATTFGADFAGQLQALEKKNDPAAVQKFLERSKSAEANNPDYYVLAANYWWGLAQEVVISTKTPAGNDFPVVDKKTGKTAGSISSTGDINPEIPARAVAVLQEGFARFPQRLDIGLGLAYLEKSLKESKPCFETLMKALDSAVKFRGALLWKNGEPLKNADHFLPESLQSYSTYFYQLETPEGDKWGTAFCRKITAVFPDHAYAYNMLAAFASAANDEKSTLNYLEIAHEKAPDDPLILMNLGDTAQKLGNKAKALEYYQAIKKLNASAEYNAQADAAISSLKK